MGEPHVVVNAAASSGSQRLAGGVYLGANPVDLEGFVVAMSPLSGAVSAKWTVDPTAQGDGWIALAEGSNRLFLAGGKDRDGVSNECLGASAWMVAVPLPLINDPMPVWAYEPAGVEAGTGVAVDEVDGVVYFVGNANGKGVPMACTIDGVCPD